MPRIIFTPGEEALAADMQVMSDATVARFDSEAQRDVQWPVPYDGALSYLSDTDQLDLYRTDGEGGGAWHRVLSVAQDGAVDVANHYDETEADTLFLRRGHQPIGGTTPLNYHGSIKNGISPENAEDGGVVSCYANAVAVGALAAGTSSLPKFDAIYVQTGPGATGSRMQTDTEGDGPVVGAYGDASSRFAYIADGGIEVLRATRQPGGRGNVKVTGTLVADNVPANLGERLAAIEARMGLAPASTDPLAEPVAPPPQPPKVAPDGAA